MSTLLIFLAVILISGAMGIFLALWWLVPRLERLYIFRPSREISSTPAEVGIAFDQHFIETTDNCRLSAWHLCPDNPVGGIVYFHGNSGNLGILVEVLEMLYRCDLQVLAVDYRGYGRSTGTPSETGLYRDALATVRYFQKNLKNHQIPMIYWGRSLGSCVAAFTSSQIPPDALILESAFRSKAALVQYYPQFRFFHPFSTCRLDTVHHLEKHIFPVLLLHGDQDRTIPLEEGRLLFEKLTEPKESFWIEGANHVNIHRVDGIAYMRRVLRFVKQANPSNA